MSDAKNQTQDTPDKPDSFEDFMDETVTAEEEKPTAPLGGVESEVDKEELIDDILDTEETEVKENTGTPSAFTENFTEEELEEAIVQLAKETRIPEHIVKSQFETVMEDPGAQRMKDIEDIMGYVQMELEEHIKSTEIRFVVMGKTKGTNFDDKKQVNAKIRGVWLHLTRSGETVNIPAVITQYDTLERHLVDRFDDAMLLGVYDVYVNKPKTEALKRKPVRFSANGLTMFNVLEEMVAENPLIAFEQLMKLQFAGSIIGEFGCGLSKMISNPEFMDGKAFASKDDPKLLIVRVKGLPRPSGEIGKPSYLRAFTVDGRQKVNLRIPQCQEFINMDANPDGSLFYTLAVMGRIQANKKNPGEFDIDVEYIQKISDEEIDEAEA